MLLKHVEKHLREHRLSAARFGRASVGDPSFVFELRRGRDPRQRTVRRVLAYIEAQRASADLASE